MAKKKYGFWHNVNIETLASNRRKRKDLKMNLILQSFQKSIKSLFSTKTLLLLLLPAVFTFLVVLGFYIVFWHSWTTELTSFFAGVALVQWFEKLTGLFEIDAFLAVAFLVFAFVPICYLMAVIFTSLFIMPLVLKWVGDSEYSHLEKKRGGSIIGSIVNALISSAVFVLIFLFTLPLWIIPGLQILVPLLLTAWLNKKVFLYDVLQDYASAEERKKIEKEESRDLYGMGILLGLLTYVPLAFFFIPVFSALCYAHYGLQSLSKHRMLKDASRN